MLKVQSIYSDLSVATVEIAPKQPVAFLPLDAIQHPENRL